MGSWNYSHVGLMFDKSKNDAKLIDQAMKCMGYKETDYLYLDETGLDGPVWSNDCGDMSLNYETPDNSYVEQILNILNTLFCDVSIYYVTALGSNTSDYYSGTEETFDLVTKKRTRKVVGNCYTKSKIKKDTLSVSELIDPELIRQLIDNGSQKGYNELVDLVKTKTEGMQYSIGEIVDGVLHSAFKSIINCVIPDSVTSIGDWAFDGCRSLTSITIPDSVTSIGNYAFYGCSSLTSITIPDSVTSIGDYAFHGCSSLTSITIPNSVTSIDWATFNGCSSLTSITIPDSVTSIGDDAFSGCSSLTSITIPDSVTSIGDNAFHGCSSLTSITIPDSVTSIGDDAFSGCSSLTSISMSNGAPDVSAGAFDDTPWVKNNPDEMIIIGKTLYKYKGRKPNISIPDNITKIGRNVFKGRKGLKSIVLPESVTSIGYSAFGGCTGLTSITIPDSVSSIGDEAFAKCPKCVIYAPAGSYSIKYAKKNKIKYIVGDDTQNIIAPVKSSASEESKTVETKSLDGLKFVVTGDLEKFTDRDELKAFIEARGGKLIGSVSSKTNYLITNEPDSRTTKIQKAQELGVQIISEAEFLKMTE